MNPKMFLRVVDLLAHIIEAASRIEHYSKDMDLDVFTTNTLVQDAIIGNIEIIGEAANKIKIVDAGLIESNPTIRFDLAYQMRNSLVHGYHSVNLTTAWNTVRNV